MNCLLYHSTVKMEIGIKRDKNKKKKYEKGMTAKFPDTEKYFHTEFVKLKKGKA